MSSFGRIYSGASALFLVSTVMLAAFAHAQEGGREALVEPTYRVSNSNSVSGQPPDSLRRIRPELDVATAITSASASSTPATSSKLKDGSSPMDVPKAPKAPQADDVAESQVIFDSAMDDAFEILGKIRSDITDYTCIFIKREKIKKKGIVGPQYMFAKVRCRKMEGDKIVVPFSVYTKFVKPASLKGREALYIENVKDGKLLAKEGGTKGRFLPAIYLPVDSRFIMADNRYPITEFGIETLTQRLLDRGRADRNIADAKVIYSDGAQVCGRKCRLLEIRRDKPKVGIDAEYGMNVPLARVFIDNELQVPIRYCAFDWTEDSSGVGTVLEEYTYSNLKLNVGLTDEDFDCENPAYGF